MKKIIILIVADGTEETRLLQMEKKSLYLIIFCSHRNFWWKKSLIAVPVLPGGIIFIPISVASRFLLRGDAIGIARVAQRVFARLFSSGIALVLGGTAYARECIGAC